MKEGIELLKTYEMFGVDEIIGQEPVNLLENEVSGIY